MQAGVGLLILDVMPMQWSLHGYRHDYSKFYQLPNSNLFTHHLLFFSREATSETYDPGSLSHTIFLCDIFSFAFLFRSTKPKHKNTLMQFILIYFIWHSIYQSITILSHVCLPILRRRYPKGIDNPFYTPGCEYLLFVCMGFFTLCCLVLLLVRYLGFITEGNTYHHCARSSLPLRGNTDVVAATIRLV